MCRGSFFGGGNCTTMYARKGGCKGGKQQRGTSLDKYTNYSFSVEELQSACVPQSNGLTWEASLHSLPTSAITAVHAHTQRKMWSHLSAIRENQVEADQFCPSNLFRDWGSYGTGDTTSYHQPAPTHYSPQTHTHIYTHTFLFFFDSHSFSLPPIYYLFFSILEDKFKRSKLENQMRALGSRRDLQSCRPASRRLIHHVPQVVNSSSICKCFQILANLYAPRFIMENQL